MKLIKLSDGRSVVTNDVWCEMERLERLARETIVGNFLNTQICRIKTKGALDALLGMITVCKEEHFSATITTKIGQSDSEAYEMRYKSTKKSYRRAFHGHTGMNE